MTKQWEYMAIAWSYALDTTGITPVWRQNFSIHRPGHETKVKEYWNSNKPDDTGTSLLEILNELGAEGWELVTDTVSDSAIIEGKGGWTEVGTPTTRQYILKRRS